MLTTASPSPPAKDAIDRAPSSVAARTLRVLAAPARAPRPNPFNRLLTESLDRLGGVETLEFSWPRALQPAADVLHFHWPEYFLRSRKAPWLSPLRERSTLAGLRLAKRENTRRQGAKIVWTVHNLAPHGLPNDRPWPAYQKFLELTDACIYLSEASREAFENLYPIAANKPSSIIPHGVYTDHYPRGIHPSAARQRLGLPPGVTVACAVGAVEPYKNFPELVRQFLRLDRQDLWLVIAGKVASDELRRELTELAAAAPRVKLHLEFVPDDELQVYFAAADFCLLPYREILNSGAAILALSFGAPVVCPAKGSLAELSETVGPQWVRTYEGAFDSHALDESTDWANQPRTAKPDLSSMQWNHIAEATREVYRTVIDN